MSVWGIEKIFFLKKKTILNLPMCSFIPNSGTDASPMQEVNSPDISAHFFSVSLRVLLALILDFMWLLNSVNA